MRLCVRSRKNPRPSKTGVDVKTISDLRTSATKHDYRGWMSKNYPCFQGKEKYFLLTSPFIEPGVTEPYNISI